MSSTILSTKMLSSRQKDIILNAGLRLVQYDAIKIVPLSFELDKTNFDFLIFTSQNAVSYFFESNAYQELKTSEVFCVGEKTKDLLEGVGLKVIEMGKNAQELGKTIVENYPNKSFLFLSGKQRLDILPNIFKKNNVRYEEISVYDTLLTPKQFDRSFNGVLFFSPSAVESYFQKNSIEDSIAFCIGPTTEKAAKNYTQNTVIANKPSIENVLIQAIKELRAHD